MARKNYLMKELEKVNLELEKFGTVFCIKDKEKSFRKYSVNEMNELYNISKSAFEYLESNRDESILDYNKIAPEGKDVKFAE